MPLIIVDQRPSPGKRERFLSLTACVALFLSLLPGQTKTMDVTITNNNPVPVHVTGLSLAFNDSGLCALTSAPLGTYPFSLGASSNIVVQVDVSMGDADPACEGNAGLVVTATASGIMP